MSFKSTATSELKKQITKMAKYQTIKQAAPSYYVGLDIGTQTGVAVYHLQTKQLTYIKTMGIYQAIKHIERLSEEYAIHVRIEDPTTWVDFRKLPAKESSSRLQGAGSVKRDFAIWLEVFAALEIPYTKVRLQGTLKKLKRDAFAKITGYTEPTSVHGRDAAMLVFRINN